ncbi:hypothetical protein R3F76_39625 [Bradyrhizobium japonicum]|uniref:hypothetical protein n=1 Tax=Bradyrhizobium japonicum TaxID=375 RepID=UPI002B48581D|nr:hypothetical protein [Bradyrhizobium japonicum]WRI85182.1 hypothetical protein R3F76_39625 [Bradyrhizobium japonicum]
MKPFGLVRDAVCDFLDVAGDVGELDAETADAVGELVDQTFGKCPVGAGVQDCQLCDGHVLRVLQSEPFAGSPRHSHSNSSLKG